MMKFSPKQLSLYAILISIALVISVAENWLPPTFIPIPGVKLGLSNIITLFALYYLGFSGAFVILILRCILASVFGGGITALIFSITGGCFALSTMFLLKDKKFISVCGVSIAGAAMHGIGQILAAILVLDTISVVFYLPLLLFSAIFTGALVGFLSNFLFARLDKISIVSKYF